MVKNRVIFLGALALAAAAACGTPDSMSNGMCGANGSCPSGYTCDRKTNRCVYSGVAGDAGLDARAPADARPDALVLDTTIDDKPGSLSGPTAIFSFSSSAEEATFECSLDSAPYASCESPLTLTGLSDGPHMLSVRAVAGGQKDSSPASYGWTSSSTAPVTTITGKPPAATNQTEAEIDFTASPAGSTTECSLDGDSFAACSSPAQLFDLAAGEHHFTVRATSPAGVAEADPPEVRWTVDQDGPAVTITAPSPGATVGSTVHLTFTAGEEVVRFECAADDDAFERCGSGEAGETDLEVAGGGAHTASVRGVDAAGNTGPPDTVAFEVDATSPAVTVEERDTGCLAEAMVFSADEEASFTCAIDDGAAEDCVSPWLLPDDLSGGVHTFSVVATDGLGNQADPFTVVVDVDRDGPRVAFDGTFPEADSRGYSDGNGEILFHSDGSAVSYRCALDGGDAEDCTPEPFTDATSYAYFRLTEAQNPHELAVSATDECGNRGPEKTFELLVDRTGPTYTITSARSADDSGVVTVTFTEDEPTQARNCELDGVACSECTATGATCGEVSAGEHVFAVQGTDAHGNIGSAAFSDPVVARFGPNAGHAILVGHDLAASNAEIEELLGNAADQVPYRVRGLYDRGLRVALFHQDSVDDLELDNVLAALGDRIDSVQEFSDPAQLGATLRGKDLLLVPDQEDPNGSAAVGELWGTTLTDYLDRGGVALVLDGMVGDSQTPSNTFGVLAGGALEVVVAQPFGPLGSPDLPVRRIGDANDSLNSDAISPLSVGASYLPAQSTAVFLTDGESGAPRTVYARVTTICSLACFTTVTPVVFDKTFPVYSFTTSIEATVGPRAAIPFALSPSIGYDHIDCAVTNPAGVSSACDGDAASGFHLPFDASGAYQIDLRVIDPYGTPGRSAKADVSIDLPVVSISPTADIPNVGAFCWAATTVDGRGLDYALSMNGQAVAPDRVKNAGCPYAVGSYDYSNTAECNQQNIFRVDATDGYGNTSYGYVSWYKSCTIGKQ